MAVEKRPSNEDIVKAFRLATESHGPVAAQDAVFKQPLSAANWGGLSHYQRGVPCHAPSPFKTHQTPLSGNIESAKSVQEQSQIINSAIGGPFLRRRQSSARNAESRFASHNISTLIHTVYSIEPPQAFACRPMMNDHKSRRRTKVLTALEYTRLPGPERCETEWHMVKTKFNAAVLDVSPWKRNNAAAATI